MEKICTEFAIKPPLIFKLIINCMTGKLGKQTLFSFCPYQQITNDETNKTVTCAGEKV